MSKFSKLEWERTHDTANFVWFESGEYLGKVVQRSQLTDPTRFFARVMKNDGSDYHMCEVDVYASDILKYHCTSQFEAALKKACEEFDKASNKPRSPRS